MGGFPSGSYVPFNLSGGTPSYADTYNSSAGMMAPSFDAGSLNFGIDNSALTGADPTAVGGGAPGMGAVGPSIGGASHGFLGNMSTEQKVGLGIGGLKTLGSLWMGLKQLSLAKKQFQFQRDFANTNLANSMKTYNTALAGRARAQGYMEGNSQADVANYVQQNSLSKAGGPAAMTSIMPMPGTAPANAVPSMSGATGATGATGAPIGAGGRAPPSDPSQPRRDPNG